jgi:nitrogen-specific signal transduction histidine kinase
LEGWATVHINHAGAGTATSVSASVIETPSATTDLSAVTAVLAHTLLNSLSIVRGGAELLARHDDALAPAERRAWYRRIDEHTQYLAAVLERVAQGRLAEALALGEEGCRGR